MGYALNAGIAAILARPEPAGAVVLAGDGGFQMTLNVRSCAMSLLYVPLATLTWSSLFYFRN